MSQKKLLGLLGALALVAFTAGCSSKECSVNADCASKGANFACVNNACLEQTPKTCSPACSGSTPVCNTATLTCVACTQNSDCSGATPTCNPATNTCVGCVNNANCSGATPVCDITAQACVGCISNADCQGNVNGAVCDTTSKTCVACTQNSDCSGTTPICDSANHTCTASCTSDAECASSSPSTPKCDTAKSVCVACVGNADCANNGTKTVCSATNTCVECAGNTDCAGNVNGAACNPSTNTCVQCVVQADCTNAATPSCTTSNTCTAACVKQTDCTISQDCFDGGQGKYCTDVDVAAASTAISAIKSAAIAGTTTSTQAVNGAIVTYLKPQSFSTTDPAGFFVQAELTGPGLFIAIDPATLTPAPAIGDRVAFTASTLAYNGNQSSVTKFADNSWQILSSGHDVSSLRADASAATDLVSALDSYESKIGSLTFTVSAAPTNANPGYMQASITTTGYPSGDPALKFYAPASTFSNKDVTNGCAAQINGVMWRFKANAEPAVFADSDLTVTSCPAPKVLSASRPSATEVDVTFDRNIAPVSVTAIGFVIRETNTPANVLAVSAAAVSSTDPRVVVLTTATQTPGMDYTVSVSPTVTDDRGTGVDMNAYTATFKGYAPPAVLRITELNPGITGGKDLIEVTATSGGALDGFTLEDLGNSNPLMTFPSMIVQSGDVLLVHLNATCTETGTQADCPNSADATYVDTAWDFAATNSVSSTSGLAFTARVLAIKDLNGTIVDGVPYSNSGTADSNVSASFPTWVQALQTAGVWDPTACTDKPTCRALAVQIKGLGTTNASSVHTTSLVKPMTTANWSAPGPASFGTYPNP